MITIHNKDSLEALKQMNDDQFDLGIVDPPYGIKAASKGKVGGGNKKHPATKFTPKDWDDSPPPREYFEHLKRLCKHVIIWGANHFIDLIPNPNSSSWLVWNKQTNGNFADCELAYTSHKTSVRRFDYIWDGFRQQLVGNLKETRIHPTQKPVALYKWILSKYAKAGDTILDTHLGSGSIAIACSDMGFDLTAYEIDKEYYDLALNRLKQHQKQLRLF
jgi:site-specific DNA-methyltransferase (adenine-specific)